MIRTVEETGSTNADLAARLSGGEYLPEGDWLVAERQTAGRGRLGRIWNDGAGNFMGSTVVRPGPGDPPPSSLALMTGLAVHEALLPFVPQGAALWLKWPNDLLLSGAKIAGILLEVVAGTVIVGIGVNLAAAPDIPGRAVTSLSEYGPGPGRDAFAEALAASFDRELHRWRSAGLAPLLRRWQSAAHPVGTRLTVLPPGEEAVEGSYAGLSQDGNLLLKLDNGTQRVIHAGDVLLASAPD
ncbi:biotin--[acetyl-CoA-carboxylase] ligase [Novosphingobium album (ex Hu et al. 2023)]|uniref:biotin--[biotin carboxyl-carrier protein] ligase n=1 Tax=Novosphingobium album (ex Hu et al. 2023) TaxID=2930093 RepID=A0ABT0AYW8_9SPHN|nr:biotin--[acetyl-CoA-carboxylase] ligase [Novosphingobium album (ex Hu et al. 2023)]MCJ2177858.1 biotin--[acetyl-CoA-carboxylase] ligase [Novosphingobium album (ex Hu et al. 2023)]